MASIKNELPTVRANRNKANIIARLKDRPSTLLELSEHLNIERKTITHYINFLIENKQIYISEWVNQTKVISRLVPKYSEGFSNISATKPEINKSEYRKKAYARAKNSDRSRDISEETIFKRPKQPEFIPTKQTWFSILECV